jgi:hypothetical protein
LVGRWVGWNFVWRGLDSIRTSWIVVKRGELKPSNAIDRGDTAREIVIDRRRDY